MTNQIVSSTVVAGKFSSIRMNGMVKQNTQHIPDISPCDIRNPCIDLFPAKS